MAPKKTTTKKDTKESLKNDDDEDLNQRLRNCCATLNNYTDEDCVKMQGFIQKYCSYGVYGKEVGESGTNHLQIYLELKDQKSVRQIRKFTPEAIANIQPRYSPKPKEAAGYCKKGKFTRDDEKPDEGWSGYFETPHSTFDGFEFGKEDISSPGMRTDIQKAAEQIKSGEKTVRELRLENPMLNHQYGRTLQEIENDAKRLKFRCGETTTCEWIHGATGVGKSHAAYVDALEPYGGYNPDKVYNWDKRQKFQCGYEQQEIVIINEYKGPQEIAYGILLELIDKWPYKIERKNPLAAMEFTSKHIVITSIFHPKDIQWNLQAGDDLDQLLDRISIRKIEGENKRKVSL